ncbi:MAG: hypothetical protein IH946_09340 [Bacteroidetes bacterium]|nr:hypothetical protein [Bacteroidota bacterium]
MNFSMVNKQTTIKLLGIILIIAVLVSACKTTGRQLGAGAVIGLKEEKLDEFIAKMVDKIVTNTRDSLLNVQTTNKIDSMLNSISATLKGEITNITTTVRDSLIGEYTTLKLQKLILKIGQSANTTVGDLKRNLLGSETRLLVAKLRDQLLGDSTIQAVAALRDELLGKKTQDMVDSLLKASITSISTGFNDQIKPQIEDVLKISKETVQETINYAAWALGVLGAVLALIIAIIWRKFSTRKKIMRILTQEIDKIKDKEQYDELVGNIRSQTNSQNLESAMQNILKEEPLEQKQHWQDKDKRLLEDLVDIVEPDDQLKEKLKAKGLDKHFQAIKENGNGNHTSE